MSVLLGTRREERVAIGSTSFGWGPGHIDFSATSIVPAPGQAATANLANTESSLQKVAVWSCVDLTASMAETLPADVYSGDGNDKRPRPMPDWLSDLGGGGYGLHDWIHQAIYSGMLRGNLIAPIIERDNRGNPRLLPLAHPDDVTTTRDAQGVLHWRINGVEYPDGDVWHKRFNSIPGWLMGLSPIAHHVLTIGTGIQAMQFGFDWFRDGAHPSSLLTNDNALDAPQADTAKKRFMAALRGRREPAVLGKGWKWQQVQIAPNESQFLETNQYTAAECCRIFGPAYAEMFGYETGGSLTYANVEQRSLDLLTYALDRWFVRIERALSSLLPAPQFLKLNRNALLRTDLLTRYKAHNISIASKWATPDEVREVEDMPPLTDAQKAELTAMSPPAAVVPFDQSGAKP